MATSRANARNAEEAIEMSERDSSRPVPASDSRPMLAEDVLAQDVQILEDQKVIRGVIWRKRVDGKIMCCILSLAGKSSVQPTSRVVQYQQRPS